MRHTASFNGTGVSGHRSASRRRHRISVLSSSCVVICTMLVVPRDCETATLDTELGDEFETERRRLQGPALQATLLPGEAHPWLQGPRLRASLADGGRIEIREFSGDVVRARALDATSDSETLMSLEPAALVGMQWTESRCEEETCRRVAFRVAAAAPDDSENTMPARTSNRDTWLYRVEYAEISTPGEDDWKSACSHQPGGDDMGLFVDGRWSADGAWHAGGYTFSCPRGAVAKCARSWGYKPWKTLASPEHGPVPLQGLHAACTRAARADYCGDGVSHTREGVLIGMSDRYGFNPHALRRDIEAAFDESGAVRVHAWRLPDRAPACHIDLTDRTDAGGADGLIEVWH
jgi:hypothetical protein